MCALITRTKPEDTHNLHLNGRPVNYSMLSMVHGAEMLKSYHWRGCFISSLLALSACESDQAKLGRLEQERTTECLLEQSYFDKLSLARYGPGGVTSVNIRNPTTPAVDSLRATWMDHHTKCALATRDYNRLMR